MTILDRTPIRVLVLLHMAASGALFAQQGAAPAAVSAPPKNLKILSATDDLNDVMRAFDEALGVQCNYCHVPGDFAGEGNALKQTARSMIAMVRQTEPFFSSTGGSFPTGYHEVDCITCHRGKAKPDTATPVHFQNKREALGGAIDTGAGVNLKVLPPDTRVHGSGSLMEDFRDALNVDCAYCHGGGKPQSDDGNPRKDVTRRMIELQRRMNANFPGTGVYPEGRQVVTCNTCHRGDPHPVSLSNRRYQAPATAVP